MWYTTNTTGNQPQTYFLHPSKLLQAQPPLGTLPEPDICSFVVFDDDDGRDYKFPSSFDKTLECSGKTLGEVWDKPAYKANLLNRVLVTRWQPRHHPGLLEALTKFGELETNTLKGEGSFY